MQITSVERFGDIGLPALFAPSVIATKIHRDRVEPSREFRVGLNPPNPEIKPNKSLLQNVSRCLVVTGVTPDERKKLRATARAWCGRGAFRSVFPELALTRVREDPRAEHVGHGRIRQVAIVEDGEAFTNGRVPRLVGGNVDRRADTDELERLPGGVNGHPDAAVRARNGFDEAPVETVGGLELHPVRHRIANSRTALAAAVGHLRIDGEVAVRCRRRGRADGNRRGEKNGVPFDALRLCRGYPSPLPFGGMSRVPRSTTPNLRVGRTLTRLRPPRADLPPQESF